MENFGNELKLLRKELGLSQVKLGELLEIPRSTLRDWELEHRIPPVYVQKLLIDKMKSLKNK